LRFNAERKADRSTTRGGLTPHLPSIVLAGLLALAPGAQATSYTNTASGNWDDAAKWTSPPGLPPVGGAADAVIVFNPAASLASTNNLAGEFVLNQAKLTANFSATNWSSGGSSLTFTNNGSILPAVTNAVTSHLTFRTPIKMATNLTLVTTANVANDTPHRTAGPRRARCVSTVRCIKEQPAPWAAPSYSVLRKNVWVKGLGQIEPLSPAASASTSREPTSWL
jgi:hypothetical protein